MSLSLINIDSSCLLSSSSAARGTQNPPCAPARGTHNTLHVLQELQVQFKSRKKWIKWMLGSIHHVKTTPKSGGRLITFFNTNKENPNNGDSWKD